MNYKITVTSSFLRELKRLAKRHKSMIEDTRLLGIELQKHPEQGTHLGNNLRKVRMAITSKGKGKRAGARVITYTVILTEIDAEIKLLTIYDKSEKISLSDKEMRQLLEENGL
ncbi:MAG: addiction module toxin RelE [Mediterranea sp.]|jgi:mRNA-degrading endonuclease RelE of RelBE toxin-antitoxin system|nr:addiction module toxin RelE [Mediterranea sp.]